MEDDEHDALTTLDARVGRLEAASGAVPLSSAPKGGCRVPGCKSVVRAKGLCSPHYQQWRRGTLPGFPPPG